GVLPRRSRRRRGRRAAAEREISQVKLLDLSLGPHRIYPATPPSDYRASASIAALPSVAGLVSGFCALSPSFGVGSLQIPPRGGHPGLASRFRSPRPAENLHLRDPKHAWQTKTAPANAGAVSRPEPSGQINPPVVESAVLPATA